MRTTGAGRLWKACCSVGSISTAQEVLRHGIDISSTRIDLILDEENEESLKQRIERVLPEGASIVRSESRTETVAQMTRAFEFNLQALSMLALLVQVCFCYYNTMTFSVVQRRPLIGRMRALGVSRKEILFTILKEALLIGVIGYGTWNCRRYLLWLRSWCS
ncbi:MAG: FtsX-like permease family protein [Gracilimonas sp.]|nr:FtsX-like permease family protein [Gracilimonas sp.]